MLTLVHFTEGHIADNWNVYWNGKLIGYLHDCDGIGGSLDEEFMDERFDEACSMAKADMESK